MLILMIIVLSVSFDRFDRYYKGVSHSIGSTGTIKENLATINARNF